MIINYLNKESFHLKVKNLNDKYWNNTWENRWEYINVAINEIKEINPDTILELGAYKVNLTSISDNMDKHLNNIDVNNIKNMNYIQDAALLPWNINDKYYDVFIALQVFEHLNNKQNMIFNEVQRISKNAILSFPYMWNTPKDIIHHNITDKVIAEWTCNITPHKIIHIGSSGNGYRIIYFFKF